MGNKKVSLTDTIYKELMEGLKTGLEWTEFLAKYADSKGELYHAIGQFFNDMQPKIMALNEVEAEFKQAKLKLDSLNQEIKQAETTLATLQERIKPLNDQIETLDTTLGEKSGLLEHIGELENLGFDVDRLRQLSKVLAGIGAKHGLTTTEAVGRFFKDLEDYDAKIGFEREIQTLESITGTKKLEAEKSQAEADRLATDHQNLSQAISAIQTLIKAGVKTDQILSWNAMVSKLGGPEDLQDKLGKYKSIRELLDAKKREIKECEKNVAKLSGQIKALNEQKMEIEGAIKSLSTTGVNQITKVREEAVTALNSISTTGVKDVTKVSGEAIRQINSLLGEIKVETKRLADLKAEAGKLEKELIYARYITTQDPAVLKAFPKEVVSEFIGRALLYCIGNQLNPMVRVPDSFRRKYFLQATELSLIDLISWAKSGLAGALP